MHCYMCSLVMDLIHVAYNQFVKICLSKFHPCSIHQSFLPLNCCAIRYCCVIMYHYNGYLLQFIVLYTYDKECVNLLFPYPHITVSLQATLLVIIKPLVKWNWLAYNFKIHLCIYVHWMLKTFKCHPCGSLGSHVGAKSQLVQILHLA